MHVCAGQYCRIYQAGTKQVALKKVPHPNCYPNPKLTHKPNPQAFQLFLATTEFHSTQQALFNSGKRILPPGNPSQGRPYKAGPPPDANPHHV
jgi:hypothetical protein